MLEKCRVCDSKNLSTVLELGEFSLSGVFPSTPNTVIESGPLDLVLCRECSLVQLGETFSPDQMYGDNYGYRSGLNKSMINHLADIVDYAKSLADVTASDVVLDIGSNDGTLLKHWGDLARRKIGIDPTSAKFREHYDALSEPLAEFFTADTFNSFSDSKAKVITSIAMLYDLENPIQFATDISNCLGENGIWVSEQSYMPWMILTGAYDTICHEHIEYYSLTSLKKIMDQAGLRVVDAVINAANGGSIRMAVTHKNSSIATNETVARLLEWESTLGLETDSFFSDFREFTTRHGKKLRETIESLRASGKRVGALGASTKGSIVVQHADIKQAELSFIGDVNPFKFGRFMANSDIPIVEESEELLLSVDVLLILPWHFQDTFNHRLRNFLERGGEILWPLPNISIQSKDSKAVLFEISHRADLSRSPISQSIW